MKQCETCLDREYKDDLMCCQCNHVAFAFREMLRKIPLIGKHIPQYKCKGYESDKKAIGLQAPMYVNCRCHIIFPDEGAEDK